MQVMSPLIHAAVLAPLRHAPGRTVLVIIAIALGVALGFAVYLINRLAADEVSLAARSLYGLADLAIEGSDTFDEDLYPRIARVAGVAVASPVVEVEAKLVGRRGALTLLGIDPFRTRAFQPALASLAGGISSESFVALDSEAVFLSARAASDLNLAPGDFLEVQTATQIERLAVAGILPTAALDNRAGVIDIAAAQWKLGQLGKLSRINIRLVPGASASHVSAAISAFLPSGVTVVTPGEAGDEALRLSRAYRSNLTALALVALFTGGFFVYSTQSLAVLRRRREFAILHALGVTRGQQLTLVLFASAAIGICGALLGTALGIAAAKFGLDVLGADLGAGYFRGLAANFEVRASEVAAFALLGAIVAVVGALRPALEAAGVPTARALKAGDVASAETRTHEWIVLALAVLAAVALLLPPIAGLPLPGYVSIALLLIGMVVAMPSVIRFALVRAPRLRAVLYQIAISQIAGTARYATLSVSAILVSFSLMVSMAIMVTSFRTSLDLWTQRLLPADVYVRVGYVGQSSHLTPESVSAIRGLPDVERIESSRFARVQIAPGRPPATLIARTMDGAPIERSLWLTTSAPTAQVPAGATPVWINEAASDLFAWQAGEARDVVIAGRRLTVFARGVWRDYEHQSGAVIMERGTYVHLTGDDAVNTVWLWLKEGATSSSVQSAIRDVFRPGMEYDLRTPGEVRRLSLAAFDRTFAVTYALELVAVLIGLFGIAAGISAQVLARRGELGALRHLGFTRAQIASMLAIEGAVLGALGVVVGLLTGGAVSLILIYVVNRQSFHWSMDLAIPGALLAGLSAALVAAAAMIGVVSGRQAMSADVVNVVKEDW
jgi:putative ABC transport system permease protein